MVHSQSNIPPAVTRWFGVRSQPPPPKPLWVSLLWAFIGAFCGLSLLQAVFGHASYFVDRGVPQLVASYVSSRCRICALSCHSGIQIILSVVECDRTTANYRERMYMANNQPIAQGASAVLIYGVPEAPLAQPRAVIGGHFISALVGLIMLAIFRAGGRANESDTGIESSLSWLAASLATSIAIVCMMASKTTHPPAGATALLPILDPKIYNLSWYFLPVVLLSSILMVLVGLITNNVQKRYPSFWWEPAKPPQQAKDEPPTLPTTMPKGSV